MAAFKSVLAVVLALATVAHALTNDSGEQTSGEQQTQQSDEGDTVEAALNHCPVMCSPQSNANHPLRPMLPNYPSYGACMDDCVCAAYCYILDSLGEWVYADCFKKCGKTKPFSGPDPNAFIRMIHSRNINVKK